MKKFIKENQISTKDIAVDNYQKAPDYRQAVQEVLKISMARGVCTEKDLPSKIDGVSSWNQMSQAPTHIKVFGRDTNFECTNRLELTQKLFSNLQIEQIQEVIEKSDVNFLLLSLRNKNCKETIKLENKKYVSNNKPTYSEIFRVLNQQLDKKQPVAISYNVNMIQKDGNGFHASTVIGRRFNSNTRRCEYQIRDSYGKDFPFSPTSKVKRENGNFWVSEEELKKNVVSVDALD